MYSVHRRIMSRLQNDVRSKQVACTRVCINACHKLMRQLLAMVALILEKT